MNVITYDDLASYLRDTALSADASFMQVVDLVNDLVAENWLWAEAAAPIPAKVRLLALNAAARAWAWNPSTSHLESITRSIDDGSRTERYRAGSTRGSVYLTEDELLLLRGRSGVRSVRLTNYGDK